MDSDNTPSTSSRAKYLKYASDKLNASNQYPVAFDDFRKFTNVDEYVVREMERSGPNICRINYHIRHEYYPIVFKKFYQNRAVREKMMRRGLIIKPIPKFLKEKLMRMPGEDSSTSQKTKEKQDKTDAKVGVAQMKHSKIPDSKSPAFKVHRKSKKVVKKSADKAVHTPKTRKNSKLVEKDDNLTDSPKITNFFSALKLVRNLENLTPTKDGVNSRKRKSETRETSPVVKRLRNVVASSNLRESKDKGPLAEVNRNSIGPKSRRKTTDSRKQEQKKSLNNSKENENRKKNQQSSLENLVSDDSDVHSDVEVKDAARRRVSSLKSTPSSLVKSPLPKRNRNEDFQKPSISPRKSARKKDSPSGSDQRQSSSDAEMALLSLSGLVKKTTAEVSCEIQDWLSKAVRSVDEESDDESAASFLEEEFTAVDKLKAIKKYPDDVRNYIKYLIIAEIQRRKISNIKPEKQENVSRSNVVAAFREMTFDDYKDLVNADKIYSQGLAEKKTPQEITSDLGAQYEGIVSGKRAWPRDKFVKLSTLRTYLRSKGLHEPVDLKCIPPRLLSFEEALEHTNLKECTSLSRSKPPGSYKQLLSLCKKTYLKCCSEGVWINGLQFTDSIDQQEEISQQPQSDSTPTVLPSVEKNTEPADQSTSKSSKRTDDKQASDQGENQLPKDVCIAETQENPPKNSNTSALCHSKNDVEKMLDQMFAESETDVPQPTETLEEVSKQTNAEQQLITSLYAPASEMLPLSQPVLGFIPPSPALFQSTGESDQRTQIAESQHSEARPTPEAVFIPCDRSMVLNTEENNLTVISVDHDSDNQDPFADPETRLDDSTVQGAIQDTPMTEGVVKKEPESENNTQTSYNPFDDSVQILDTPPSEPIEIEDEESAPELLDMLLKRPSPKKSAFVTPTTPPTQSSACTETFVHAQQLPSNLSSSPSQLNPSQPHEEIPKEPTTTEPKEGEENDSGSFSPLRRIKTEKDAGIEAEVEHIDIDVILNILKTDSEELQQSPPRQESLQSTEPGNESRPHGNVSPSVTTRDEEHSYSVTDHKEDGSMVETSCVSIPPQRISSKVEITLNVMDTISIHESTLKETDDSVVTYIQGDPTPSEETEATNEKSLEETHQHAILVDESVIAGNQEDPARLEETQVSNERSDESTLEETQQHFILVDESVIADKQRDTGPSENEKSLEKTQQHVILVDESVVADNQTNPVPSEETEATNERSEYIREEECIEGVVGPMSDIPGTLASVYVISMQEDFTDTNDGTSDSLGEDVRCAIERLEGMNLDQPIETEESRGPVDLNLKDAVGEEGEEHPSNDETREDIPSDVSLIAPLDISDNSVAEKTTSKDLNDNLPGEPLHLAGFQDVNPVSSLSEIILEPHVDHVQNNANSETFVGEISSVTFHQSELFVGFNLEVNTNVSQANTPAREPEIEMLQACEEDNQVETNAAKIVEQTPTSDQKGSLEEHQQGAILKADAKDGGEAESNRQDIDCKEQTTHAPSDKNPVSNLSSVQSYKEAEDLVKEGDDEVVCEEANPKQPNLCSKAILNAVESNEHLLGFGSKTPSQQSLADTSQQRSSNCAMQTTRSEYQTESSSNSEHTIPVIAEDGTPSVNSPESTKKAPPLVPTTEAKQNKKKTFVLPALLPIAALKSDKIDEFIENSEMEDEPEIDDEKDDLVEVPVLINRRFIKMLPFSIVTPQQIEQTTKESTIYALKTRLEFCLEESAIPDGNGENEAVTIFKQIACPSKQKNTVEDKPKDNTEAVSKSGSTKRCSQKRNTKVTVGNLKANTCTSVASQLSSESKPSKATQSTTNNKRKKVSPKKGVKKTSALDFVPQKTHAFRALSLGVTKKNPPNATRPKVQTIEEAKSKTEESNYNIEDVSQAVASSTASQILGTDCTYFESSQLLRNIEGCCQPAAILGPPEDQPKVLHNIEGCRQPAGIQPPSEEQQKPLTKPKT